MTTLYSRATHTYTHSEIYISPVLPSLMLVILFHWISFFFVLLLSHYTRLASPFQGFILSYESRLWNWNFGDAAAVGTFFIVGASYLFRVLPIYISKLLACLANGNIIFCECPKCVSLGKRGWYIFAFSNCVFHLLWKANILPNEGNHLRERAFFAFRFIFIEHKTEAQVLDGLRRFNVGEF